MKTQTIIITASIFGAIAVMAGAMGAHALKELLPPDSLTSFLTGTKYNMYHAIALLAIAGNSNFLNPKWMTISVASIMVGVILFSGSIYILSTSQLTGIGATKILGPITPIGGLFLIFGWISIAIAALKKA